jgi:hypothetical protein
VAVAELLAIKELAIDGKLVANAGNALCQRAYV